MSDIYNKPIAQRIEWLFELAHRHGEAFRSPEAWLARERYLSEHPTAIAVLKCMDGRINIPVATNTPIGLLMPFRNLGGMFDLGWPHLGEVLSQYVLRMTGSGRRVLILITYHWSKGSSQRGCAGFNYDTEKAVDHTRQIYRQVEHIFGSGHRNVYPLICGFETDEDALMIHGKNGDVLDLAVISDPQAVTLAPRLEALLPDMPAQMRADLLPLLRGNLEHVAQVREQAREHKRVLDIKPP